MQLSKLRSLVEFFTTQLGTTTDSNMFPFSSNNDDWHSKDETASSIDSSDTESAPSPLEGIEITITNTNTEIATTTLEEDNLEVKVKIASVNKEDDDSTICTTTSDSSTKERQVIYGDNNNGAASLFAAIEASDWNLALRLVDPMQARTWFNNMGTSDTTLAYTAWSLWRRLPIHEACRRQAPACLISKLLDSFPESACRTTQFGELPLHLAVQCGNAPEVVNVLVAANFEGIVALDNSGRTPLDCIDASSTRMEQRDLLVYQSLLRASASRKSVWKTHQDAMEKLQREHAQGLVAIRTQHDEELKMERQLRQDLANQVARLSAQVQLLSETEAQNTETMDAQCIIIDGLERENESLTTKLQTFTQDLNTHDRLAKALNDLIAHKNTEIDALNGCIVQLSSDLQRVQVTQKTMTPVVHETEEHLRRAVTSFLKLQETIQNQDSCLRSALSTTRGRIERLPTSRVKSMVVRSNRRELAKKNNARGGCTNGSAKHDASLSTASTVSVASLNDSTSVHDAKTLSVHNLQDEDLLEDFIDSIENEKEVDRNDVSECATAIMSASSALFAKVA